MNLERDFYFFNSVKRLEKHKVTQELREPVCVVWYLQLSSVGEEKAFII